MGKDKARRRKCGMEFKEWLQEALSKRPDLNQLKLAEMLGVVPSAISGWVNGRSKPRPEHVEGLAHIFRVEKSILYRMLGIEVGPPHEFGPEVEALFQELDNTMATVESDYTKQTMKIIINHAVAAIKDLAEQEDQKRREETDTRARD